MMFKVLAVVALAATAVASPVNPKFRNLEAVSAGPSPTVTNIPLGSPYYGTVPQGEYVYYSLTVPMVNTPTIDIDISPFVGDPDVFVSTSSANKYPGWAAYDYESVGFSTEHITIYPHDSHNKCPTAGNCTVYVSVYGFSNASFVIWAGAQDSVVELYNGYPFARTAPGSRTQLQYFEFYAGDAGAPVIFQATVTDPNSVEWELSMFVTTGNFSTAPTPTRNQWSSIGDNGYHYTNVIITPSDPNYCAGCKYYIGVQAPSFKVNGINYTMVATNGANFIQLTPGVKQMGHTEQGQTQLYYTDVFGNGTDWTAVSVVPEGDSTGGDPDLYVVAGPPPLSIPSPTNWMWKGIQIGGDIVNISSSDPLWSNNCANSCNMHIAVVGFQSSTYTITVSQNGTQHAPPSRRLR